jgi:hypothetical protein
MSTLLYCYDMICTTHSSSEERVQHHGYTDSGTSTVIEIDSKACGKALILLYIHEEVFPDTTVTKS